MRVLTLVFGRQRRRMDVAVRARVQEVDLTTGEVQRARDFQQTNDGVFVSRRVLFLRQTIRKSKARYHAVQG